ncbi:hypothetical protein TNCV_2774421 [Trichonephila clavipes]|nr:hypothetical protein TNCV_2774421 [Trichonephila clavipes]
MQVRTSAYVDSIPYHPTSSSVLRPFTNECGVISSAPVPYKNTSGVTSRLNQDSSVNSTWLQSCCSQSRCSASHLLRAAR